MKKLKTTTRMPRRKKATRAQKKKYNTAGGRVSNLGYGERQKRKVLYKAGIRQDPAGEPEKIRKKKNEKS